MRGTYALPPGYSMLNGTSMASPQARRRGGAAGQRRQAGRRPEPAGSAPPGAHLVGPYLDRTRTRPYEQGNGLIDVDAAWDLLKTNIKPVDITSSVPVNTHPVRLPGDARASAQGIYDREGVTPATATPAPTRSPAPTGGGGTTTYNLSWIGNDGTFSSRGSIALPQNSPTSP